MSLKYALEELGVGPCYHMIEVFDRPADIPFWSEAITTNGVGTDWNHVFREFGATTDCPGCYFWKQLHEAFPTAKVILTTRPADAWYDSFRTTVFEVITRSSGSPQTTHDRVQSLAAELILNRMFHGKASDRDYAIEQFTRHNSLIEASIPSEQLLNFNVADGWEPLCRFLGYSMPDSVFPRTNTRADFQTRFNLPHSGEA